VLGYALLYAGVDTWLIMCETAGEFEYSNDISADYQPPFTFSGGISPCLSASLPVNLMMFKMTLLPIKHVLEEAWSI